MSDINKILREIGRVVQTKIVGFEVAENCGGPTFRDICTQPTWKDAPYQQPYMVKYFSVIKPVPCDRAVKLGFFKDGNGKDMMDAIDAEKRSTEASCFEGWTVYASVGKKEDEEHFSISHQLSWLFEGSNGITSMSDKQINASVFYYLVALFQ